MLISRLLQPLRLSVFRNHTRSASIVSALNSSPVLVSSNRDIYTNLALEHWLYTNLRFNQNAEESSTSSNTRAGFSRNQPVVLIWTDEPCVVMGRHQNPWVETTLGLVNKLGIKLARRHSGGGCVYHDENNINISLIGDRKMFEDRQANLRFLAKILDDKYGIGCEPNKRHDLIHSATGRKMSGSAAKLGRYNSYHHFTLLVDTDTEVMQAAIRQKQQEFVNTNSSVSTRSDVINLKELKGDLTVDQVISDLAQAYGNHYKALCPEESAEKREAKLEGDREELESLNHYKEELMSWKWIYGMTPKFKLQRNSFEIDCDREDIRNLATKFQHLVGTSFAYNDAMVNVVKMLQVDERSIVSSAAAGEQIFATYLLQMIHDSNF